MTNYELSRYDELKDIINKKEFSKIDGRIDIDILNKSDLKEYLIKSIIDSKDNIDLNVFLLFSYDDIVNNRELAYLFFKISIDDGCFYGDQIIDYIDDPNSLFNYFFSKIRDDNYRIKKIDSKIINDKKFINYCLYNNKIEIFSFLDVIDYEYYDIIKEKINDGYGFLLNNSFYDSDYDVDEYDELFILNLKNGYISSYLNEYLKRDLNSRENEVLEIIKKLIDDDKEIIIEDLFFSFNKSFELINYILETKKYRYLFLMKLVFSPEKIDYEMLNDALKNNPNLYEYFELHFLDIIDDSTIITLLENNVVDVVKNISSDFYFKYKDLINNKIIENHFHISNCSISYLLELGDKDFVKSLVLGNIDNLLIIINYINYNESMIRFYDKDFYDAVRDSLCLFYGLNDKHLDIFISRFGYGSIRYLENANIRNAINLENDNFNSYLKIFDIEKLDIEDVKNIYDSLLQYRFKEEHMNDIDRFTRIKLSLSDGGELPIDDLRILADNVNISKIKKIKINNHYLFNSVQVDELESNALNYLIKLCNEIKEGINVDNNILVIYYINRQYLKDIREKYRNKYNYLDEVSLDVGYDEKSRIDSYIKYYFCDNQSDDMVKYYVRDIVNNLKIELSKDMDNEELIWKVIYFIRSNGKDFNDKSVTSKINKVKIILNSYIIANKMDDSNILSFDGNVKKILKVPNLEEDRILSILGQINPYELVDTVFGDNDKKEKLYMYLKKYKFIYWQDIFSKVFEKSNVEFSENTISSFITKFSNIYNYINEQDKLGNSVNLVGLINYANVLGSSSNRYSLLFGKEDSMLIKLDPTPNESVNKKDREKISVSNLLKLYKRKYVTVPPIDKIISVNGKSILINIGNFTNPINLTYGERTGSCMRIGGEADSLYNFCLSNPNGFHIRFMNPVDDKFISRVSGFRNGNSVFLNELRYSKDDKYNNNDLIGAIRKVADIIISSTRDSDSPIENVFITKDLAMISDSGAKVVEIKDNIKSGYDVFYFDMIKKAVCLKTTAKDSDYAPLRFDINNPKYVTIRDSIRVIDNKYDIFVKYNGYRILKEIISKNNPDEIMETELVSSDVTDKILCLVSGEDFIVYLDDDMDIKVDYIERDDYRVKGEIKSAVKILESKREEFLNEGSYRKSIRL